MSSTSADVVIVGGGLAAVRTAEALRAQGYDGRVRLLSDEALMPYDRPPLSKKVLLGKEQQHTGIGLTTAEKLEGLRIEISLSAKVVGLDRTGKNVVLENGDTVCYGKLVVATGASPVQLPMLAGYANVHVLRSFGDARRLHDVLASKTRLAIVGAGFIGLEIASAAIELGCSVTMIEAGATPLGQVLGSQLGEQLRRWHERRGVSFLCGTTLRKVHGQGQVSELELDDGGRLAVDAVVVGVGQRPNVAWLRDSGLETHVGLVCDAWGRTIDADVYGVGDAVCCHEDGGCNPTRHWTATTGQAPRVALSVCGKAGGTVPADDHYFWSDQHGSRIQFVGRIDSDASIRYAVGSADADRFLALCHKGEVVTGVLGVGCPRDFLIQSAELKVA